ncbi:hypothetical protein [Burkholderia cenocepacia]|uniref:hypothetical protein n=1 Tax=Burkholderia cenocepacia TaxID=95486 RepID=UPI001BA0079A|nr:hypothetical protein [Burkholderia cenocepacia]MBR8136847.1 hypothetical protein [Burkholderia cenocepacia]
MIHCKLFTNILDHLSHRFKEGEPVAVVMADATKLKQAMMSSDAYYYNDAKVQFHAESLKKGKFEIPLICPQDDGQITWIEGFHQVQAILDTGVSDIPVSTSVGLAFQLRDLIGSANQETARQGYSFSGMKAFFPA